MKITPNRVTYKNGSDSYGNKIRRTLYSIDNCDRAFINFSTAHMSCLYSPPNDKKKYCPCETRTLSNVLKSIPTGAYLCVCVSVCTRVCKYIHSFNGSFVKSYHRYSRSIRDERKRSRETGRDNVCDVLSMRSRARKASLCKVLQNWSST